MMRHACIGIVLAAVGCAGAGLTPTELDVAGYGAELEVCRESYEPADCEGYLACRHEVQDRYRQPRTLTCEPVDAGADGAL